MVYVATALGEQMNITWTTATSTSSVLLHVFCRGRGMKHIHMAPVADAPRSPQTLPFPGM